MRFILSLCLLTLVACRPTTQPIPGPEFAIHLLKNPQLPASQVWDQPLENLALDSIAFMTSRDLVSYSWKAHKFVVSASADSALLVFKRTLGPVGGLPFVVMVGDERIYLGAFWYPHSSLMPKVPYIDVMIDPYQICRCPSVLATEDKRVDNRIYQALRRAGVLVD